MTRLRSGKMNNAYQCMLDRLKKFNEWEKGYNKNLSIERRLDQYRILFDLGLGYKKDVVKKMHRNHLRTLVEAKKALRNAVFYSKTETWTTEKNVVAAIWLEICPNNELK